VETAAYFVVSEAVTNAVKHAAATAVSVRVFRDGGRLTVRVEDDGAGGADPAGGGLSGLRGRVAALDGTLHVDSPLGGPTVITAELPCA
jgi:signal transduction histidine kinase